MLDERNRRGMGDRVVIESRPLRELLEDYEKLDSFCRAQKDIYAPLKRQLNNVLQALYHQGHDSERLMLLVMDILRPLIKERIKTLTIDSIYH